MFILQFIAKIFKILRSDTSPKEIAIGFILGMVIGLTPFLSLHNFVIILMIILFSINVSMAIFSFGIFSGVAYLFDPLFHDLGFLLLVDFNFLKGIWSSLYNVPVLALSRYNNTIVMGSLASAIVLLLPCYIFMKKFVVVYREKLDPKFQKWKIVQTVKGSKIYTIYNKIRNWSE